MNETSPRPPKGDMPQDYRDTLVRLGLRQPRPVPPTPVQIVRGDGIEIDGETWTVMSVHPKTVVVASRRATKVIARADIHRKQGAAMWAK